MYVSNKYNSIHFYNAIKKILNNKNKYNCNKNILNTCYLEYFYYIIEQILEI